MPSGTSHYLNQCRPSYITPCGVTRPRWVKNSSMSQTKPSKAGCETSARPLANARENLAGRVENRPGQVEFCIGYIQGSHAFRMMKFLDFSRTFPGPNLIFQGPSRTKTTINMHKYSLPSNRFSLLLHKQGKQWFNGTYQEILMNNISEICVNNIQVSH